jgi:TolB protein
MKHFLRFFLLVSLLAAPALAQKDLGRIEVAVDSNVLLVRVSGSTPELNDLALRAFNSHGRYKLAASGYTFDIRFSPAGPAQVRVDILRGSSPVASETVSGNNLRHALLRAADVAVEKTNGLGLKGYFTARLAFIRDLGRVKEVCTSDLFFSSGTVEQVSRNNSQALSPRWSPDGSRILFTGYMKGFPDIYMIDLAGRQLNEFARYKGTNSGGRFSPNGRQVAMVCTAQPEGTSEIFVSNSTPPLSASRRTHSDAAKASPCWSPDGGRIVFAMGDSLPQLYMMSSAGGTPQRLTIGFSYAAEPDWSRTNPNRIACTVKANGSYQIAVYDLSKGKAEVVSKAPFDGVEPSWLADGRHLVYTARTRTESRLCILDTETGKSVPVSPGSFGLALQGNVWTP